MEKTKAIKLPSGATLNHGQMFIDPRAGKPKRTQTAFAPVPGMKRASVGEMHPYLHGTALEDEPNSKIVKSHEREVPIHPGMRNRQVERDFSSRGYITPGEGKRKGKRVHSAQTPRKPLWFRHKCCAPPGCTEGAQGCTDVTRDKSELPQVPRMSHQI
jgi:hypothetical protein